MQSPHLEGTKSMKRTILFRVAVLTLCVAALAAAYKTAKTEALMYESATLLVQSLNRLQKASTLFDFDAKHRTDWHYFPETGFTAEYGYVRNGITFGDMEPKQAHFANALLGSGLSQAGFVKAAKVMGLERIVGVIEDDNTGYRDPQRFHFTIFGEPSLTGDWGWRVEGHHLSLHYTIKGGELVSSSPTFFGANPHEVAQGPHKGFRVLAREEDLAVELMQAFTDEQRKQVVFTDIAPYDVVTMADKRAKLEGKPQGLPSSKMNDQQYEMLLGLIAEYANNLPIQVSAARMKAAQDTPRDQLFFAWAGRMDRPAPKPVPIGGRTTGNREKNGNYYRIQSPAFLIEYDNTQNISNHSHSVWREFENDYGLDVLAQHHKIYDHAGGAHVALAD